MNVTTKNSGVSMHRGAQDTNWCVDGTAQKIRMAQISFADEDAAERRGHLEDVIRRDLESVVPEERNDFLEALQHHFPCLDCTFEPKGSSRSEDPPFGLATLEQVVDRLTELVEGLQEDERKDVIKRLEQAGLVSAAPVQTKEANDATFLAKPVNESVDYVMMKLRTEKLNLRRTVKLVALLVEFTGSADDVIWQTWRTVAPRSSTRRPCDLQKELRRYISGDRGVSGIDLKRHIEGLKKMIASLIAGMGQVGASFSSAHMLKYSPRAIETEIEKKSLGLLTTKEHKCWNLYQDRSKGLSAEGLEHNIKETIAMCTERLLKQSQE